ncbi:hypothetical protein KIW84_023271 [Lathyrus oleraceus]|uniref:Retrovirus-related Pol polyprotein from transposon TNT 1-94-like beta-barrel domain-containing protein n=1 Tax=Pisum sativum TaxID=3888 RepID=A0A9D4YCJ4_PEA|nr:hypothetical protein KIW84_023271 [Pisum sativum]
MASTSNSFTVYSNAKVPLFEGENYDFLPVKMETLFTYLDVLEFVQNGYEEPAPTEAEESSQRLEELKKKKKIIDVGVLRMIQRAISISIIPRIMRAKTSKEAWNILQQGFEEDSNGKPQCHNCKRFGHIQKDYRFANQQHASFAEGENDEGNLFFACQKAFQEDKNVWYLDSGCRNHMTGKNETFISIDSSFGSKVKLGNGEHDEVKGKGSIGVTTK